MKSMTAAAGLLMVLTTYAVAQDARRVSRAEALDAAVSRPQPEYPAIAKQLHIEGSVDLEAAVTETGAVEKVTIVTGNPFLTNPAAEAVKRWKFKPFLADGKPVKAIAPVSVT